MNKLIQYLKIANLSVLVIVFIFFPHQMLKILIDLAKQIIFQIIYRKGLNDNRYGDLYKFLKNQWT